METYFSELDENGVVLRVIVARQDFIDSGALGDPKNWIQTYMDGTRKNYAGKGYKYDKDTDAFIPPKPYDSWVLDSSKTQWVSPKPIPQDEKRYKWDETNKDWVNPKTL